MADIFDEVNEDLRADRARDLLKSYGPMLLIAAGVAVVATGGWQAWRWRQAKRDMGVASEYIAAMYLADQPGSNGAAHGSEAIAAFERVASHAPEGYATLARLRIAALKAESGDLPGAASAWDQVAGDGAADPLLRDLAGVLWVQREVDVADPGVVEARLKPLTAVDNPFRFLASELQAQLAIRQGKPDEAKQTLSQLVGDPGAPEGVRARAAGVLNQLGG